MVHGKPAFRAIGRAIFFLYPATHEARKLACGVTAVFAPCPFAWIVAASAKVL
jgi:hypothetical protein